MKRNLTDACNNVECSATIIRDCSFDQLYLVGKPFPYGKKTVSYIADTKYIKQFSEYDIDGVICTPEVADALKNEYNGGIVVTSNPRVLFWQIHNYYAKTNSEKKEKRIAETAIIHERAIIDDNVSIGENVIICANTVIKEGTVIGDDCIIREGCVIGAPAFYYYGKGEEKKPVISSGSVEIGNNVELHTSVTVEKGVMGGATKIGDNTKIDNLSLIGHDSIIGKNVTIAAGSTLAGGVELGDDAFLGVGVTIAPYVKCGAGVKLSAGAVATKNIPAGFHASGNFAIPHDKYLNHIKEISR